MNEFPKNTKRKVLLLILLVAVLLGISGWGINRYGYSDFPLPTSFPFKIFEVDKVEAAIQAELDAEHPHVLALLLYETRIENISISRDGRWATGWLIPLDPSTGEVVPIEPGLALVAKSDAGWKAFLPSNPLWSVVVQQIPDDLLSPEIKQDWFTITEFTPSAVTAPLRGYKLPWAGGDTMVLTQSVGHDRYTPSGSAHFAFDFAKPGYPSGMFDVYASKGGIVKQAVWKNPNGNPNLANYIVLEDTTTTPTTYQLYMHLAQNSIPANLRVIGTPVRQGQKIGIADDTGVSSGNHLHFMVHTSPASYWGSSVDITFDEVTINGGRPRIASDKPYCKKSDVCDATQTSYVSQNFMSPDHVAPTGGITSPPQGSLITSGQFPLQGWARDDNSGIGSVQFKALYNNEWHLIGSPFSSETFTLNWDMCADKVPDGPVSLALAIRDKALNEAQGLPGLTHFTKNFECPRPPSACTPGPNQAALFAGSDYQGQCVLLNIGSYPSGASLGKLGEDNAASIIIGANVQATLFSDVNQQGRAETFWASTSDANLSDNLIGADITSSVIVQSKSIKPSAPILIWPPNNMTYTDDATFSLSWANKEGATLYQMQLTSGSTQVLLTPWVDQTFWHLSSLSPGTYSWKVKAKNPAGESSWSSVGSFEVATPTGGGNAPQVITAPFVETMESTPSLWVGENWKISPQANHTIGGSKGWMYPKSGNQGYDNGSPNSGYLTSPAIEVPADGVYYLQYFYRYETESPQTYWDQRLLQVSVDNGPFQIVDQLSDDPMGYWLQSRAISLADYAGKQIRLRFYFATLDSQANQFSGWEIDDVQISQEAPPLCTDQNDSPSSATNITAGETLDGVICPSGDVDYYKFQLAAGNQIGIRLQAQTLGSPLDTSLTLIDSDGESPLAYNDDIVLYEKTDSFISYRVNRAGVYYAKVQAWDHPNAGSPNSTYKISLYVDNQDPDAAFVAPLEGSVLPAGRYNLEVAARDTGSGVSLVRFYWHSNNWNEGGWNYLGEDWDPGDGWNFSFDTSIIPNRVGAAVYAVVFDWAGNWVGTGAWNLSQEMLYLPQVIQSH